MHVRYQGHMNAAASGVKLPVYGWIRNIKPGQPQLVILEIVRANKQVEVRPGQYRALGSIVEAKWLKRFRRTALNVTQQCAAAMDDFVNPPGLNPEYLTEE